MNSIVLSCSYSQDVSNRSSHFHDCHQILSIKKGSPNIVINGKKYIVKDNSLIFINRFEEHSIEISDSFYERYVMRISPFFSPDLSANEKLLLSVLVNRPQNFSHIVSVGNCEAEIIDCLEKILKEKSLDKSMHDYMLDILLYELLLTVFRIIPENFTYGDDEAIALIDSIKSTFENSYENSYTLAELALKYGVSQSYLSHTFKKVTGIPVMEYLLSCRIAAAKKLLAKTDRPIGDIVELCGFTDFSNFSRIFKQITSFSPSEFRKSF